MAEEKKRTSWLVIGICFLLLMAGLAALVAIPHLRSKTSSHATASMTLTTTSETPTPTPTPATFHGGGGTSRGHGASGSW